MGSSRAQGYGCTAGKGLGLHDAVGDENCEGRADPFLPIHPPGMVEVIPKRCVPIAKKELLYMGTVGWACWLSGIIFIDRQRTGDAIDVISQTAETIRRENVSRRNWAGGRQGSGRTMGVTVGRCPGVSACISPCPVQLRVWIFPEGTRNQSRSMLPFKRGAFHLAVQAQVRHQVGVAYPAHRTFSIICP